MKYIKIGSNVFKKSRILSVDIKETRSKNNIIKILYLFPHIVHNSNNEQPYYKTTMEFKEYYSDKNLFMSDMKKIEDNGINFSSEETILLKPNSFKNSTYFTE